MKIAGKLTAKVLNALDDFIKVGITTQEIDDFCAEMIKKEGGISACLGYQGYPKNVCTSINDVVCHGIPDNTKLKEGDIINVDVTSIVDGYFGDASKMYCIGDDFKTKYPDRNKLVQVTKECLEIGIKKAKPGHKLLEIGKNGYGKEYYDNGRIKFEGEYLNGKRNGDGKEYDKFGNLIYEGKYLDGKRIEN